MAFTRFTLRQIEAFITVADLHSFSMAADRLGLTAQAVSQLVAELETALGFKVFDRTTRRVALSSAGKDFFPSALTLIRHVSGAESAAAAVRNQSAGLVRVGAPMVIAATALPAAIREYQRARPNVDVRIRDIPVDLLVESVEEGDVDLAVGPDRHTGDAVERIPLFDSPWVLWCSKKHPLAKRRSLTWADLPGYPLVAAGRDHERSVAQMQLSTPEDRRIIPVDIVDNVSTALGIAAQGLAATLAPAYVGVLAKQTELVSRRVLEPETVRKVCLYRPVARTISPATAGFAEHLKQWMVSWQGRPSHR